MSDHFSPVRCLFLGLILITGSLNTAFAQSPSAPLLSRAVEQRLMAPTMWVPGTVVSRNDAWISAEVSGRLTSVVEVGDAIAAQAPLAQLDSRALQLKLEDNEANIKRLQASLAFNAKQLDRLEQLRKSDSAIKNPIRRGDGSARNGCSRAGAGAHGISANSIRFGSHNSSCPV